MCAASTADSASGEPGVPVVALQQFLAALRAKDFVGAKKMAFRSAPPPLARAQTPAPDAPTRRRQS